MPLGPFDEGHSVRPEVVGEQVGVLLAEVAHPEQVDVRDGHGTRIALPDRERRAGHRRLDAERDTGASHECRLAGAELALDRLHLTVGGLVVFERGAGVDVDLQAVRRAFEQTEIEIVATLGLGEGSAEAWGCDLSEEYVRINADYTT